MKDTCETNKRDLAGGNVGGRSVRRGGGATAPATARATASESKGIAGLLKVRESEFSKKAVGAAAAAATA